MRAFYGTCGEPRYVDFEACRSLLITGAHSVGKSTLIHLILQSIFSKVTEETAKITLMDANKIEFGPYAHLDCVDRLVVSQEGLYDFLDSFEMPDFHSEKTHFIVIDDLDYFDFAKFPDHLTRMLFGFIDLVNLSRNVRLIAGCSSIHDCRNYLELQTRFQGRFLFHMPTYADLAKAMKEQSR